MEAIGRDHFFSPDGKRVSPWSLAVVESGGRQARPLCLPGRQKESPVWKVERKRNAKIRETKRNAVESGGHQARPLCLPGWQERLVAITPLRTGFTFGRTLDKVSSVMKFHKPLRMICFVQAETEGDTLFFVFPFVKFRLLYV